MNDLRRILCRAPAILVLPAIGALIVSPADGQTNQLLRSGAIEQFGDIKVYSAAGVEISVEAVNNSYFVQSDQFASALASAEQAGGVVEPGWHSTGTFEEWSDRIILTRTTDFTLVDGARFKSEFLGGPSFQSSPNLPTDNTQPPDMLQLATDFIAAGGHLDLYPAARDAGNMGPQALLDELNKDIGPVTFTEIMTFGRVFPVLDRKVDLTQALSDLVNEPPQAGQPLDPQLLAHPSVAFPLSMRAGTITPDPPQDRGGGQSICEQNMLNGFIGVSDYSYTKQLGTGKFYFEFTLWLVWEAGVRIPWQATVTTEPSLITASEPNQTPFTSSLGINTLNAPADFYRSVGIPTGELHSGKEFVLRPRIGLGARLQILGTSVLNRWTDNPLVGGTIDLGMHFDPPLGGATVNTNSPLLPYETTGMGYENWVIGTGVDLKADLQVTGEKFELNVAPHNSWNTTTSGGLNKSNRTLVITQENTPGSLPFAVDNASPKSTTSDGNLYYRHGATYSDATYHASLKLVPWFRVRTKLKLSNFFFLLNDLNLPIAWIPVFGLNFDEPQFRPHKDTEGNIETWSKNKRELGPAHIGQAEHEVDFNMGLWTTTIHPPEHGIDQITEFLNPGTTVTPGGIIGGGVFDPVHNSITWQFPNGVPPAQISYQIEASASTPPRPVGSWTPQGETTPRPILTAGDSAVDRAELALQVHELAQRPTLEEVQDGRLGSVVYEVGTDGKVRLTLGLETSEDLSRWTPTTDTIPSPLVMDYDLPAEKRFFRFTLK